MTLSLLLGLVFIFSVLQLTFAVLQKENRYQLGHSAIPDARNPDPNPLHDHQKFRPSGWGRQNTRLRIALTVIAILTILFNFMPFRSRVIAHVCGVIYFTVTILAFVAFFIDLDDWDTARDAVCPSPFTCHGKKFVVVLAFDLIVALGLLAYCFIELWLRYFWNCEHCGRKVTWPEHFKHSSKLCSSRPVRCENCTRPMTAKEYVYKHRYVCGVDHALCPLCGSFIPEWAVNQHKDECLAWAIPCTMCGESFKRIDMTVHAVKCPEKQTQCNDCKDVLKAKDLVAHRQKCLEVVQACEICGTRLPRMRMEQHITSGCRVVQ